MTNPARFEAEQERWNMNLAKQLSTLFELEKNSTRIIKLQQELLRSMNTSIENLTDLVDDLNQQISDLRTRVGELEIRTS